MMYCDTHARKKRFAFDTLKQIDEMKLSLYGIAKGKNSAPILNGDSEDLNYLKGLYIKLENNYRTLTGKNSDDEVAPNYFDEFESNPKYEKFIENHEKVKAFENGSGYTWYKFKEKMGGIGSAIASGASKAWGITKKIGSFLWRGIKAIGGPIISFVLPNIILSVINKKINTNK